MVDLSRYTALYLADGREHLKLAADQLMAWERQPELLAPVAEMFRAFHSLKGSAATMGFEDVVAVAHGAETLLDAVRRRELAGSRAVVGMLFEAIDLLEGGLEPATRGEPLPDAAALAAAMERLASTAGPAAPAGPGSAPAAAGAGVAPNVSMRAVRVDPARLDELLNLAGELVVARNRLLNASVACGDAEVESAADRIDSLVRSLHAAVFRARLAPLTELFGRLPRVVRDLAAGLGRSARLEMSGEEIELDRTVLEELVDPMIHLLRNAVDHGIEPGAERVAAGKPAEGVLRLSAERRRDWIVIRLADDGRGIDRDAVAARAEAAGLGGGSLDDAGLLRVLAAPGFTMKREVSALSGRGVGMDAVVSRVRALGGRVELRTVAGAGTTFDLTVPMTAAIQRVLLVGVGGDRYAIPFQQVREAVVAARVPGAGVVDEDRFSIRDRVVPYRDLATATGAASTASGNRRPVLMLEWAGGGGALAVDALLGQRDVLLERVLAPRTLPGWVSGATILADGAPAFLLDPTALF